MDGKADHVSAPFGRGGEIAFVPLPLADQFDRIREAETAENQFVSLRVDELVPFHFHPAFLG